MYIRVYFLIILFLVTIERQDRDWTWSNLSTMNCIATCKSWSCLFIAGTHPRYNLGLDAGKKLHVLDTVTKKKALRAYGALNFQYGSTTFTIGKGASSFRSERRGRICWLYASCWSLKQKISLPRNFRFEYIATPTFGYNRLLHRQ